MRLRVCVNRKGIHSCHCAKLAATRTRNNPFDSFRSILKSTFKVRERNLLGANWESISSEYRKFWSCYETRG